MTNLKEQIGTHLPTAVQQAAAQGYPMDAVDKLQSASRLTPAFVSHLPQVIQDAIAVSYNDALTPRLPPSRAVVDSSGDLACPCSRD